MRVRIWTDNFLLQGEIDTFRDERLTDYIRDKKDFIAVTGAKVLTRDGSQELFRAPFLNVSTGHIEIILPDE